MKKVMILVNVSLLVSSNIESSELEKKTPEKETAVIAGLTIHAQDEGQIVYSTTTADPGNPGQQPSMVRSKSQRFDELGDSIDDLIKDIMENSLVEVTQVNDNDAC